MANQSGEELTIIGKDMQVEGTLQTVGPLRVSGTIVGSVRVGEKVVLSREGVIEGTIVANEAEIANRIKGDLTIREFLHLRDTAIIEGDIHVPRIQIDDGARLMGICDVKPNAVADVGSGSKDGPTP
jgi:cytoskeletal protein CcmA (bactofilin family)